MKTIIAVVADLHVGSTVGLRPPIVTLDDGSESHASAAQNWLYECWLRTWVLIDERRRDARLWTIVNGDAIDGDHHGTFQIWTQNPEEQIRAAEDLLTNARQNSDAFFVVRGTEVHVGNSGWSEEALAKRLDADHNGHTHSWYRLMLECEGVKLNVAHHGLMGRTEIGRGNAANRLALDTLLYATQNDIAIPDLVIRSDRHRVSDSYDNYRTRAVFSPCWQLGTSFVYRLDANAVPQIGALLITCEDGSYTLEKIIFRPKEEPYWKLP